MVGMSLLAGRDFTDRDGPGAPWVAIVNQAFADQILKTAQPVGRTFQLQVSPGERSPSYQVVGVVRNTKYSDVRETVGPIVYFPEAQVSTPEQALSEVQVFVRSKLPPRSLMPSVTAAAHDVSPALLVSYRTVEGDIERSFLRERLMATLSGFFAVLAAVLATIGLYGVMSYVVARRRNEIGVRMALGADERQVVGLIMGEAVLLVAAGLIGGGVLSLAAARSARTLLFGLQPNDPATMLLAAASLTIVALVASYVPAWRAAHVSPTTALREE
jgi:hypothetical protein